MIDFGARVRSNYATLRTSALASAVAAESTSPVRRDSTEHVVIVMFAGWPHKYPLCVRSVEDLAIAVKRLNPPGVAACDDRAAAMRLVDVATGRLLESSKDLKGVNGPQAVEVRFDPIHEKPQTERIAQPREQPERAAQRTERTAQPIEQPERAAQRTERTSQPIEQPERAAQSSVRTERTAPSTYRSPVVAPAEPPSLRAKAVRSDFDDGLVSQVPVVTRAQVALPAEISATLPVAGPAITSTAPAVGRAAMPSTDARSVQTLATSSQTLASSRSSNCDQAAQTVPVAPAVPQSTVYEILGSPTSVDGLIGRETFTLSNSLTQNLADVRVEAIDRFCARNKKFTSPEALELAIRDGRTGKPVLVSRDLRKLAQEADGQAVLVDVYFYLANSPAARRMTPAAAQPQAPTHFEDPAANALGLENMRPAAVVDAGTSRRLDYDDMSGGNARAAPPAPQPVRERHARIRESPPRPRSTTSHLAIPVRYGDLMRTLLIDVKVHPTLDELVRESLKVFLPSDTAERLSRRAVLTYFRNAIGVLDARHVTMSSDAHVAGLVWEVLERERRGESAAEAQLAVHV